MPPCGWCEAEEWWRRPPSPTPSSPEAHAVSCLSADTHPKCRNEMCHNPYITCTLGTQVLLSGSPVGCGRVPSSCHRPGSRCCKIAVKVCIRCFPSVSLQSQGCFLLRRSMELRCKEQESWSTSFLRLQSFTGPVFSGSDAQVVVTPAEGTPWPAWRQDTPCGETSPASLGSSC